MVTKPVLERNMAVARLTREVPLLRQRIDELEAKGKKQDRQILQLLRAFKRLIKNYRTFSSKSKVELNDLVKWVGALVDDELWYELQKIEAQNRYRTEMKLNAELGADTLELLDEIDKKEV